MLRSAKRHQAATSALAQRAIREARKGQVGLTVVRHQAAAALTTTAAMTAMLAEQNVDAPPEAALVPLAFTADPDTVDRMTADIKEPWRVDRIVSTLVADAARSAGSVSIATRPKVYGFVRVVSTPCCSRCAILAGREYRWDADFPRHPQCDCSELPIQHPGSEFKENPHELVEGGHVTGMSKADMKAYSEGADLNQLVNAKRSGLQRVDFGPGRTVTTTRAGTTSRGIAGRSLGDLQKQDGSRYRVSSRMRMTPDSIYRVSDGDRTTALRLLKRHGYIT